MIVWIERCQQMGCNYSYRCPVWYGDVDGDVDGDGGVRCMVYGYGFEIIIGILYVHYCTVLYDIMICML